MRPLLLETVPPESKEKLEEVVKTQAQAREQAGRWMQHMGGDRGGPGGDNGPVTPPRPPEADKKADF